jgi:hypothetical protein
MKTESDLDGGAGRGRWRNIITGECRDIPPSTGELDWVEGLMTCHCPY